MLNAGEIFLLIEEHKMEKVQQELRNILSKIEESHKLQVITCISLCSIIIIIFLLLNNLLDFQMSRKYTVVDDIRLINSIENLKVSNGIIELDGYAFLLEQNSENSSISILLREVKNSKEIWLDVDQITRADVNTYFDSEYNYENIGFKAFTKETKLKTDTCYEILINIDYKDDNDNISRITVSANTYILNSELYAYNPYTFDHPDMNVEFELLRNVFADGQLCFYQEDIGMYVYQYEGKLYWIATKDFEFNENNQTYIVYRLYTTQANKLSENRIQDEFDILSFHFEQYEYKNQVTEPYRVAIRDIPNDYAISYIKTGVYNTLSNQWLWDASFHLKKTN